MDHALETVGPLDAAASAAAQVGELDPFAAAAVQQHFLDRLRQLCKRRIHVEFVVVGEAFQLADDILDVTSSTEKLGKKAAKDSDRGKPTLVASIGVEASRKRARELAEEAIANLASFGQKAAHLKTAARFIVDRKY